MSVSAALRDFVELFERLGVRYAVIGGIAVRTYGIPRPTYDVDFTIALPRGSLPELYRSVMEMGYTVPEPYTTGWVDQVAGMPVVKLRRYVADRGVDIDLFLAECNFQQSLLERKRQIDVDGLAVWLVSPEDLILLKLLARRKRDLADIDDILFTQGELDETYMRRWATNLGTLDALEQCLTAHRGDQP
ncbi:MAG TPA: nucleotidyltransferase [Pirellulales bacterium]|jgi:predicted nucleotidyltransferase|nr:nucleotidyltransferase [Pirellulales bacterium]